MSETKRAHPAAAASQRAERGNVGHGFSRSHDSTSQRARQFKITALLSTGAANGVKLADLCRLTGLDERAVRARIHAERKAGSLILADCRHGYFLPNGEYDVRRFIRSMSHRAREINAISRAAEDALAAATGQMTFGVME